MNGPERVRLQRLSGVREIVADLDRLKVRFGFSRVKVLTPRAETNLRLGKKSRKPIRVLFEHTPSVKVVFCFTMEYPTQPLIVESVHCLDSSSSPPESSSNEDANDFHGQITTTSNKSGEETPSGESKSNDQMNGEDGSAPSVTSAAIKHAEVVLKQFISDRIGAEEGYAVEFAETFSRISWPVCSEAVESSLPCCDPSLEKEESDDDFLSDDEDSNSDSNTTAKVAAVSSDVAALSVFSCDNLSRSTNSLPVQGEFKCRKCRHVVFSVKDLEDSHLDMRQSNDKFCDALLLNNEKVDWANELAANTSGSLPCPKCSTKLGVFDWCGSKCKCGNWIAPSFRITNSKVDAPPNR